MKKILLILLLFTLFFINNVYTQDCPEGYTAHVMKSKFWCNPNISCSYCEISIYFCCKWDPNLYKLDIIIDEWRTPLFPQGWCCEDIIFDMIPHEVFDYFLETSLINHAEEFCFDEYPPYDHPTLNNIETEIFKPICIYYENAFIPPYPNEEPMWLLRIKKCAQSSQCIVKYRICKDYSYNPPVITKTFIERYISGYCNASPMPANPLPEGKTWEEHWITDCYYRGCY